MPTWNEYKAEAKARGSLAFEVFVAVSTPSGSPDAVKANLPAHLAYIGQLEADGALMFAGPLSDESGELMQGTGMIVLRAGDDAEARTLLDGDPMHASGARGYTLRKWLINEGSLTLTIGVGGQTARLG